MRYKLWFMVTDEGCLSWCITGNPQHSVSRRQGLQYARPK